MLNKVQLIGNITQDIELKQTPNGQYVVSTSLATNETYTDKEGNKQESVEFHSLVFWGKIAELVGKYVHKGDKIYVEGKLTTKSWEKDNIKRYKTEIQVQNIEFLTSKKSNTTKPNTGAVKSVEELDREKEISVEDVPF